MRRFKLHLLSAVVVNVSVYVVVALVPFFVLLIHFVVEKNHQTKMKLKVSFKTSEHKNWGNADKKLEAMIETYPMMLMLLLPAVLLFVLMLR